MSGTCPISCLRGCYRNTPVVPSGKRLHHYGKSPFFMGKSTINGPFSIANCLFTGGYHICDLSMRHVHLGIAVAESGKNSAAPVASKIVWKKARCCDMDVFYSVIYIQYPYLGKQYVLLFI